MPNFIDEYLLKLGATVDQTGMAKFQNALREASSAVDTTVAGMAASVLRTSSEIVAGFVAIGTAAVGLVDKVAMADQQYRLFGLHMYMSRDAARSLKVAMDALDEPLENLTWDPELRGRALQLIQDQRQMAGGGDFEAQMVKLRDIRFQFTRMAVEMQYLGMHFVSDFLNALGTGPDWALSKLRAFNDWVVLHLPELSKTLVRTFLPVWKNMEVVFTDAGLVIKDFGTIFTEVIGIVSGDRRLIGAAGTVEGFATAVSKIAQALALVGDALASIVDLLAQVIQGVVNVGTLNFKDAAQNLQQAKKDVKAPVAGALLAGGAVIAASLLLGQPEGAALAPEAAAEGALVEGEAAPFVSKVGSSVLTWARKHWLLTMGGGALIGSKIAGYQPRSNLVDAVIAQESGGNPTAVSAKGAVGLMQLMPSTAAAFGADPRNPAQNVAAGTAYLKQLLTRYHGNEADALGAYNWGPGNMDKFLAGRATMPAETRNYISSVLAREGKTGSVQVGSLTINIAHTNAKPEHIRKAALAGMQDYADKQTQRTLVEFNSLGWAY